MKTDVLLHILSGRLSLVERLIAGTSGPVIYADPRSLHNAGQLIELREERQFLTGLIAEVARQGVTNGHQATDGQ